MRYFLSQPPLRWAVTLGFIAILVFMVFTARRRQRVIPEVEKPKNRNLEFVKLIGTLYYQKHDYRDLVLKKYAYFAEEMRRVLHVDLTDKSEDLRTFSVIATQTGMEEQEVSKLVNTVRQLEDDEESTVSRTTMESLINQITTIWKRTNQEPTSPSSQSIAKVVVGQELTVDLLLTAILANGHVLIEGVPGVAKTLLARLVAKLVDADFSRVQFTPDLMPSDVLGTTVFNMKSGVFDFHPGPVFADIVLVDEVNRAPAKTQAALFEVMEERQVTIDGKSHRMGDVYTILATQNPVEQEGTYKLPEAQTDRFMMKITMGYPSLDEEVEILERHHRNSSLTRLEQIEPVITKQELLAMRQQMEQVVVDPSLLRYIALIVQQTRTSKAVFLGASPRASVAILQTAKAMAMIQGRDFVTPEDIQFVTPSVMQHRIILTAEAEMEGYTTLKVAQRLINKVEVPK